MLQQRRLRDAELVGERSRGRLSWPLVVAGRAGGLEHVALCRRERVESTLAGRAVGVAGRDGRDLDLRVRGRADLVERRFDPRAVAGEGDLPLLVAVLDADRRAVDEAVFEQRRTHHVVGVVFEEEFADDATGGVAGAAEPLLQFAEVTGVWGVADGVQQSLHLSLAVAEGGEQAGDGVGRHVRRVVHRVGEDAPAGPFGRLDSPAVRMSEIERQSRPTCRGVAHTSECSLDGL